MPTYSISGPDGKTYSIDGPDGASREQIIAKIQERQQVGQQAPQPTGGTAEDVAKSGGIGVAKGAIGIAGSVGDINSLVKSGSNWVAKKLGATDEQLAKANQINNQAPSLLPTSIGIQKGIEGVTGDFYKPQTTAGRYAESVGEMVPSVAAGPGGLVRKSVQAIGSGVGAEAAGDAAKGTAFEPYARIIGALGGGYSPDMLGRIATPIRTSPERQRLVDLLTNEGVTSLTAGQRTGNKALGYAESILGDAPLAGQQATKMQQEGQRQFTEAAMQRAGAGPNATPEVLRQNNDRLGQQFEDLSARNNLNFDGQFANDVNGAIRSYARVPPSQQKSIVEGYVGDILDHVQTGQMPGAYYQEMRSRLSRQAKGLRNSDPTLSDTLRDLRDALDSNMRRSINPADRDLWDQSRREYSAQKVLEKAASRAGEATAEGQIVPSNLRNTVAAENRGMYSRGQGDFSELARAGSGVMSPLPNSGTGQRNQVNQMATMLGGGAIGLGGGIAAGGPAAIAAMLAGAAAPGAAGRVLMSRPAQRYLSNRAVADLPDDIRRQLRVSRLANALLEAPRQ